jgi:4-diphosphocytidyl-2-C-methyl-D-erythritol kinase
MMLNEQLDDTRLLVRAPAKVNLFLEILNKRPDGYHNISSLFQAVTLFDDLVFEVTDNEGIGIETTGFAKVPLDQTNLIWRAYDEMKRQFGLKSGLNVRLHKRIPVAAGLAGGSSDAAATVLACNLLFDLGLENHQMAELGLSIGSDIPFFFTRGQALVTGRGETIEETSFPTDYWLILLTPQEGISTAESYAALNLGLTMSKEGFKLGRCQTVEELVTVLRQTGNDFEKNHLESYPNLARMKEDLLGCGALFSRLSGSGPTMFGMFINEPAKERVSRLRKDDRRLNIVKPLVLDGNS